MQTTLRMVIVGAVLFACSWRSTHAEPARHAIDGSKSSITIHVYKTGFFSAFAHNHEIEAPVESGEVVDDAGQASVEVYVDARRLRVIDPEASTNTRAQIQKTMLSAQVLDADRYPEIRFRSTTAEPKGTGSWLVNGTFQLHGQKHPLRTVVVLKNGLYAGSLVINQTDFGITPVALAGGTIKVKNEVKVEFQIALSQQPRMSVLDNQL